MASNSLTGYFAIGKQADRTTQATSFIKALALTSGLGVTFDESDALKEHPSTVAGTSFAMASPKTRTGFLVPWAVDFVLRPNFFPRALQSLGFTVASGAGPEANTYEHVCTVDTDANMLWMSVISNVGGSTFSRRALSARASALNITANNTDIRCALSGTGLNEGNVSGTPSFTSEVTTQILPTTGSLTANFDGGSLTSIIRGLTCNIAQPLKEGKEELPLFQSDRTTLDRQNIDCTGDLQGIDAEFDLWKKIIRGGTSGTTPSLTVAPGDLNFAFNSASYIGATTTLFSVAFALPSVMYTLPNEGIRDNNDDLVRVAIGYNVIADVATPITITVINGIASY